MEKTEITIIGAGAVGLAIASEISADKKNIFLLEKNEKSGQETSSRNSEVIHGGIYYQEGSLKAGLCVKGKTLLYQFLEKYSIPYKKCSKYIIANTPQEEEELEALCKQAEKNGADDLKFLSKEEINKSLPKVNVRSALFSPSTGIFDTHKYMQKLESICNENNVLISCDSEVIDIKKSNGNYKVTVQEEGKDQFEFLTEIIINSAGLQSDKIANLAGMDSSGEYQIHYAKGEYFTLSGKYKDLFSRV